MSQYNTEILHGYKEDIFILSVMLIWNRENVGGDAYSANVVKVKESDSAPWKKYYICRDRLGSITMVLDSLENIVQNVGYDAWGNLRNPQTHALYTESNMPTLFLERGYTGHEHLPEFGLINMNARLYDPVLGRFLSPDPYVQMPDNSQNFNRYSYCLNNPLKSVDPSGEFIFTALTAIFETAKNVMTRGVNFSHYNYKRTVFAAKIDAGLFQGNFSQVSSRLTWGISNALIGNIFAHFQNLTGKLDGVTHLDGVVALNDGAIGNPFTIGPYVFGSKGMVASWKDHTFVHEYGHTMQSNLLGPLYVPLVAMPSMASTTGIGGKNHSTRWFEVWASRLGGMHFDKKYGRGKEGYQKGNPDYFDIDSFSTGSYSAYKNPRTNNFNEKAHPISGHRNSWADYGIPLVLDLSVYSSILLLSLWF